MVLSWKEILPDRWVLINESVDPCRTAAIVLFETQRGLGAGWRGTVYPTPGLRIQTKFCADLALAKDHAKTFYHQLSQSGSVS